MQISTLSAPASPSFTKLRRAVVGGAGAVLLAVGMPIVSDPVGYQASMGSRIPNDPTLLSDLRAQAGAILAFGLLMLLGAWRPRWTRVAATAGATLYLGYAAARVWSIAADGMPATALVGATALEGVLGLALALVAFRERRS